MSGHNPDTPDTFDRAAIERALQESRGNIAQAAKLLGISRQRVYRLRAKYGLESGAVEPSGQKKVSGGPLSREMVGRRSQELYLVAIGKKSLIAASSALSIQERLTRGREDPSARDAWDAALTDMQAQIDAMDDDERLAFACRSFCDAMGIDPLDDPVGKATWCLRGRLKRLTAALP